MKVILVSLVLIVIGFLVVSKFLTGQFPDVCGQQVQGSIASCSAGFRCISRSMEPQAPGKCVFATDLLTWWDITAGSSPLEELSTDLEVMSELNAITACPDLEQRIKQELESVNYCEVADDCTVKAMQCPFGCTVLINKTMRDRVDLIDQTYNSKSCPLCNYQCVAEIRSVDCVENTCQYVDTDKPSFR